MISSLCLHMDKCCWKDMELHWRCHWVDTSRPMGPLKTWTVRFWSECMNVNDIKLIWSCCSLQNSSFTAHSSRMICPYRDFAWIEGGIWELRSTSLEAIKSYLRGLQYKTECILGAYWYSDQLEKARPAPKSLQSYQPSSHKVRINFWIMKYLLEDSYSRPKELKRLEQNVWYHLVKRRKL